MGTFLIRVECPEERFIEWSTVSDAPCTYGMTEEGLYSYIQAEYGKRGVEELPERIARCREKGTSSYDDHDLESAILCNRAGPNETEITLEEIIEMYCRPIHKEVTKLKPCPFCGGEAEDGYLDHYMGALVYCTECPAEVGGLRNPDDAIAEWNRRTEGAG